jgi:hypothetical protein
MVLFESDAGVPGETAGIGLKSMQEALNLSADLLVRQPLVSQLELDASWTSFFGHPAQRTPACSPGNSPAWGCWGYSQIPVIVKTRLSPISFAKGRI